MKESKQEYLDLGSLAGLIDVACKDGIKITAEAGEIRLRYADGALTDEMRNRLRNAKEDLVAFFDKFERVEEVSYAQRRLAVLEEFGSLGGAFVISIALRVEGSLDTQRLSRAWDSVVARHESLRTIVVRTAEEYRQVIARRGGTLEVIALEDEVSAHDLLQDRMSAPFVGPDVPPVRACAISIPGDVTLFGVAMHHNIGDAWSLRILARDLMSAYEADHESTVIAPAPRYCEQVRRERRMLSGEAGVELRAFWREELKNAVPVCDLPTDRGRPAIQDYSGALVRSVVPAVVTRALTDVARANGATLYSVVLAAFQTFLARWSGQEEVSIGTPVAMRDETGLEDAIGYYVNTLVMRGEIGHGPSFADHVAATQRKVLDALDHKALPFELIVKEAGAERDPGRTPLFDAMFVMHALPEAKAEVSGFSVTPIRTDKNYAQTDLHLSARQDAEGLHLVLEYATALFEEKTAERMLAAFSAHLADAASHPERSVELLDIMPPGERGDVVEKYNTTAVPLNHDRRIEEVIRSQCAETPDAPAVRYGSRVLNYADLSARVDEIAARLARCGIGRGAVVGVLMERCEDLPAVLLGIMQAGAAYLPLDPDFPEDRLSFIAADAGADAIVALSRLRDRLSVELPVLTLETPEADPQGTLPAGRGDASPDDPAYVMYTSGSTGRPKGVVVAHRGVVNRILWMQKRFGFGGEDRGLQKTPFSFDVSVWEIFWPFFAGAELVIARPGGHRDPQYLAKVIEDTGVTVVHFVPSMLRQYVALAPQCDSVRLVACTGEALAPDQPAAASAAFPSGQVVNLYGPTEASVDVTYWVCDCDGDSVPIGHPMANVEIYILDSHNTAVPIGVAGEIAIGGICLAQGYKGRPGLTAERFVPSPFGRGERLYLTGDIGRRRPDGAITYVGRRDGQVKIRGNRIELGEVEAAIAALDGVQACAVAAKSHSVGGDRLVGYVVGAIDPETVRDALRHSLPEVMIPSVVMRIDALPTTTSGKTDRKALPEPGVVESDADAVPRGEMEEKLAAIWCEVLGCEAVGRDDNFFSLGGDSILALVMVSNAARIGLHIPPSLVFRHQTVAALAAAVPGDGVSDCPDDDPQAVPLLPAQRWFLGHEAAQANWFNQSLTLIPSRRLDAEDVCFAAQMLVKQHPALRYAFDHGAIMARTIDPYDPFEVVTGVTDIQPAIEEAHRTMDLVEGRLFAVRLLELRDGGQRLALIGHHLAVDAVSWRLLVADLEALIKEKDTSHLPATQSQSAFCRAMEIWARSEDGATAHSHWKAFASGVMPVLRRDFPQGTNLYRDQCIRHVAFSRDETDQLETKSDGGIQNLVLAALAGALCDWSDQDHVLIAVEGHGRLLPEGDADVSRTVGWYTSFLPVLLTPPSSGNARMTAHAVARQIDAIPGGGCGFGALEGAFDLVPSPMASVEVAFNYFGRRDAGTAGGFFTLAPEKDSCSRDPDGARPFLIEVNAYIEDGALSIVLATSDAIHTTASADALAADVKMRMRRFALSRSETPAAPPQSGNSAHERRLARRLRSYAAGD